MCVFQNTILDIGLSSAIVLATLQQCNGGQSSFEKALSTFVTAPTHDQRIAAGDRVKDTAGVLFGTTGQEWFMTDSHTRSVFRHSIKKYEGRLTELIKSTDGDERLIALRLVGALGVEGRRCVPVLRSVISNGRLSQDVRWAAFFALCQITPPDQSVVAAELPAFMSLLGDSLRESSGGVGQNEKERLLHLHSSDVVRELVTAFVLTNRAHTETPALVRLLSRKCETRLRIVTLAVLGMLEEDAEVALTSIRDLLASPSAEIRNAAAHAIVMITRSSTSLVEIGRRAGLSGSELNAFVRYHSRRLDQAKLEVNRAASAVREQPKELLPIYMHMIGYAPERFKREAIVILREVGAPAHRAVPLLTSVSRDRSLSPATRAVASSAIRRIKEADKGSYKKESPQEGKIEPNAKDGSRSDGVEREKR